MPRLLQFAVTLSPGAIPVALPGSLLWFGAALDNIGLSFLRVTLSGPATKRPFNLIDPVSPPCREAPAQRAPARSQCPDPAAMSLLHPATCSLTFLSPGLLCGQGGGQCHILGGGHHGQQKQGRASPAAPSALGTVGARTFLAQATLDDMSGRQLTRSC